MASPRLSRKKAEQPRGTALGAWLDRRNSYESAGDLSSPSNSLGRKTVQFKTQQKQIQSHTILRNGSCICKAKSQNYYYCCYYYYDYYYYYNYYYYYYDYYDYYDPT